jgi:hypothetical protein
MAGGSEQVLATGGFNGWPDLWVGTPGPAPPPRPEVGEFYAGSYTVAPGDSVTLSWSTFGADQVTLDGATVAAEGSQPVQPGASSRYTLSAGSSLVAASDTRTVTITVNETPQPVAIVAFVASSTRIEKGQSTTLTWQVANATTLDLDGERAAPSDSREVTPLQTTRYVLNARGHAGPIEATVTVTVDAQSSGLLPDRGGFRCAVDGVGAASAGAPSLLLLAAGLLAVVRRARRRR